MTQSELLEAIDIWAIGVTLFVMITGAFPWQRAELSDPHYAKYVEQRLGTISASKCTSVWSCFNLSPDVTDLLVHMLEPNLSLRWSLARVSTHPWFKISHSLASVPGAITTAPMDLKSTCSEILERGESCTTLEADVPVCSPWSSSSGGGTTDVEGEGLGSSPSGTPSASSSFHIPPAM
eukprot:gene2211-2643_t